MPPLIKACIETHQVPGYVHRLITLENCFKGTKYIQECLAAKRWAKAADYLRIYYLYNHGGIYLDADVKVVGTFDDLLDQSMFCGREENGFVSNAIIGSEPCHMILEEYLGKVERNFIGSGDLVYQPGMYLWTEIVLYSEAVNVYPPEYFLPYNHHLDRILTTENTRTIHYFNQSWVPKRNIPIDA